MQGIIRSSVYLPYRRLDTKEISGFFGAGGARTARTVASHDEDTTTMGVEAARPLLRDGIVIDNLSFTTPTPAYGDKNNASTLHAALRLDASVGAWDTGNSLRSSMGQLLSGIRQPTTTLLVSSDMRDGLPTSTDESNGGDGAAALILGMGTDEHPVIAEFVGSASLTDEFLDRWRNPGERRSRVWEERFGETRYLALGKSVFAAALENAGVTFEQVDRLIVTGLHARAVKAVGNKLSNGKDILRDELTGQTGQIGGAHPLIALSAAIEEGLAPNSIIVLIHLADGADAIVLKTTDAAIRVDAESSVATQLAAGAPVSYGKFLSWRDMVNVEPPRRPEPARVSSSAAWRSEDWKFGFVGSKDPGDGTIYLPPARVSRDSGDVDSMEPVAMADRVGTIVTFTIDRMAYSPSPPTVFAIVDFEGGGRFPVELTDVDAQRIAIGDQVVMTFRRLFTADGIHDYFWKARPVRSINEN